MEKFQAIMGVVITVILAVMGIDAYSSGSSYMAFFGIELSAPMFYALMAAFLLWDVISIKKAFSPKKQEETTEESQTALQEEATEEAN